MSYELLEKNRSSKPSHKGIPMSISRKGLLLATTLGAMEIAFLGALGWQLHEADLRATHQTEIKDIYLHSQELIRSIYVGHESLCIYILQRNEKALQTYENLVNKIDADLEYLSAHTVKTSDDGKLFYHISECSKGWLQNGREAVQEVKASSSDAQNLVPQELIRLRNEIQRYLTRYWTAQQDALEPITEREDLSRKNMEFLVWAGLSANILFAFAIGVFFARDIAYRLLQMVENTSRLRFNRNLLSRVGGADEIAQLDEAFHKMANQVRETERMKKAYIAMFRDELAQPLTEVTETINEVKKDLPEEGAKLIRNSDKNLKRLIGIIGDLTGIEDDAETQIKLELKQISVQEIIDSAVDSVKAFASSHAIKIEANSSEYCDIEADGNRLIQILVNFLSNASKFSAEGSIVKLTTIKSDDTIRFQVIDCGRGIPLEKQKTVFEKFKQTDAADGARGFGTGLGLSICKVIAELHGGSVGVESVEGKGSTFWFEIPIHAKTAHHVS